MKTRAALRAFLCLVMIPLSVSAVGRSPALSAGAAAGVANPSAAGYGTIILISVASDGTEANDESSNASISADGRYVVFESEASNLVPDDTNGYSDVFLRDLKYDTTTRVSVAMDGTEGNGASTYPQIAAEGRYVAFQSAASNLVRDDTNGRTDVFVYDIMPPGEVMRVSMASDGAQGNGDSRHASISENGWYIAFESEASNLVPDDTNGCVDVFRHDWRSGDTLRVSVASDGSQGNGASLWPSISARGRQVAFESEADNLVLDDTNGTLDVFVYDERTPPETLRVSVASDGIQGNGPSRRPSVSAEPRYVAFESEASNLVLDDTNGNSDIYLRDLKWDKTTRVSVASDGTEANGDSWNPYVSGDGRWIIYDSAADNLVGDDTNGLRDVFAADQQSGAVFLKSISASGCQANDDSWEASSSESGKYVVFESAASNLVEGDANGFSDVFFHDRASPVYTAWLPVVMRQP